MKETILYGLPKNATERHEEVLLLTNATPALIEQVKALAAKDGFHSFRVAEIDLSIPPDFAKGGALVTVHSFGRTSFGNLHRVLSTERGTPVIGFHFEGHPRKMAYDRGTGFVLKLQIGRGAGYFYGRTLYVAYNSDSRRWLRRLSRHPATHPSDRVHMERKHHSVYVAVKGKTQ
jgi:hypothetical protein